MKSNVDRLYDRITGNMIRQRRLISILLVLSILVSSGVLWGLRDTGISMANDAECGIEEHIHTDECYGDILVCGYDDEGELAEDEVEYQYVRTCGLEESDEHTHDMDCFSFVYAAGERNDAAAEGEAAEEITADAVETGEEIQGTEEAVSEGVDVSEDTVKHVHTAECYARGVICGKEEHDHVYSCYFGDVPEEEEEEYDPFDNGGVVLLNSDADDEETEYFDAAEMMVGAAGELPGTIETIDNIAEGIRFNLFDYISSDLESQKNNYDITRWDGSKWLHGNIKYTEINTGRNAEDDILFFAYGTPSFNGTQRLNDDDNAYNIYTRTDPDKNNYSGDYNTIKDSSFIGPSYQFNHIPYSEQVPGNRPVTGIVDNILYNNYPAIAKYTTDLNGNKILDKENHGNSLDYLFNPDISEYKAGTDDKGKDIIVNASNVRKVYTDVNHILQKNNNNHLVFDSDKNYAYFNENTNSFTVYSKTFDIVNDAHHKATDINAGTNAPYDDGGKDWGFKIGFFPFDQYDETKVDPNFDTKTGTYNHHFGMTMNAKFLNSHVDSNNPDDAIMFSYSGDDDMWVFVDDVLVLDVGGIHEPTAGLIDFTHGIIWTQDNAIEASKTLIKTSDGSNYETFATYAGNASYPKPMKFTNTTDETYNVNTKWIIDSIENRFKAAGQEWNPYGEHTIKMFYLERGGCYSNLAMDMNLPTYKNLVVEKTVDKGENPISDSRIDNAAFNFRILQDKNGALVYPDVLKERNESNEFTIYPYDADFYKRVKVFENLSANVNYVIQEYNVDSSIYEKTFINTVNDESERPIVNGCVTSDPFKLEDVRSFEFKNTVWQRNSEIVVNKEWINAQGIKLSGNSCPDYPVKFKLYRSDSVTPSSSPVLVSYDNKRTFVLDKNNSWTKTFNLPVRYGNHVFTYSAVEVNTPESYNASYRSDGNTITITNTDKNKVDIYVEKEWENIPSSERPEIKLTLMRKYKGYESSASTSLRVNICDERGESAGHIYKTETFSEVYVGGSVEFHVEAPEGSHYYQAPNNDHYTKTPSQVVVDDSDGMNGYFEISNLAAGENVVNIYYTTDSIVDSTALIHHSFTKNDCGWIPEGSNVTVSPSNNSAYSTGDSLVVHGMTDKYDGVKLDLDPAVFRKGRTYTFSVYVWSPDPDAVFQMVFFDGFDSYKNIATQKVEAARTWTQMTVTYTLPDLNPYNIYLKIQHYQDSVDSDGKTVQVLPDKVQMGNGQEAVLFRIDDFVAMEGNKVIRVDNDGIVNIKRQVSYGNSIYKRDSYNSQISFRDLRGFGAATVRYVPKSNSSNEYLEVSGRTANWNGVSTENILTLTPGLTYQINVEVSSDKDDGDHSYTLTFAGTSGNTRQFSFSSNGWNHASWNGSYTIPSNADTSKLYFYIESGDTADFRVYDFTIRPESSAGWTGWSSRGNTNLNMGIDGDQSYVKVSGRTDTWMGARMDTSGKVEAGKTYLIKADVLSDSKSGDHTYNITLCHNNDNGEKYVGTGLSGTSSGANHAEIQGIFTAPDDINSNNNYLYIESGDTDDFRIYSFEITPVEYGSESYDGYELIGDYYKSTVESRFGVAFDENSATNPLILDDHYTVDNTFSKEITLAAGSTDKTRWEFHSSSTDYYNLPIESTDKKIYSYYVEETKIGGMDPKQYIEYYEVSIKNDNVSNNDSDTPIIVHNKYIWYRLPATGGSGTTIYFIGGIAFILLSLTGAVIINRRRSKNN